MWSLRASRSPKILFASRTMTSSARFASTQSKAMKSARVPGPPEYKGRITKPQPKPQSTENTASGSPLEDATGTETPARQKPEPTKEQRYRTASRRYLAVMVGTPIAIVLSYYLYRRLFLGEERKTLTLINEATE